MSLTPIDFACNDPDNGEFAGKVWMASYRGNELESRHGQEFKFSVISSSISIHRHAYKFEARKCWMGNWCWDRFWFAPQEAKRLLRHLRDHDWRCTEGWERFCVWMNDQPEQSQGRG